MALPAFDLGVAGHTSEIAAAVLLLGTVQRPMRECTLEDHLAAMVRQAELDARAIADILGEVISAVLDEIDLSIPARAHANELMAAELLRAAARWDARERRWLA
jgi:hypothetical protein